MYKMLASLFFFLLLAGIELSEGVRSLPNEFPQQNLKNEMVRTDVEVYNGVPKRIENSFAMKSTEPVLEAMGSPTVGDIESDDMVAQSFHAQVVCGEQGAGGSAQSPGDGH
ncbi:hypothetical protein SUGI_0253600 [Cryptomeria japonica]|nr:hypothetical protein SUGI_0253600 [Cryptomeria japonica]